ncbi:hypothetical protein CHCC15075_2713 [Bacillus licheniformis]|uniref:Uncharacterized protein n=1 Tax=Bacillus licheniformis TaxID=1402 RepID=A0A8B5YK85_BACLI|nr:hypothetical protein B4092_3374 [Bacillus licheniformis]KYC79986.1 hypothetical protein B4091_3364 [Bacillus licheniformis]KYC93190.1 hypothetical protein B4164_3054 [Bacillus licheniformis]TWJ68949.1 hypothetical protein CHCC5020_4543 [Bacillus licheniformis]TWL24135.1 hypothetical protein CHCC15546_3341 [Bacillus licheniformis]
MRNQFEYKFAMGTRQEFTDRLKNLFYKQYIGINVALKLLMQYTD